MNEELSALIDDLVAKGASDEEIDIIVQDYVASKEPAGIGEYVQAGVGMINRGLSQVISEPIKFLGAINEGMRVKDPRTGEPIHANVPLEVGGEIEDFTNRINPEIAGVNQTFQDVFKGLGQAGGMIATGGLGGTQVLTQSATKIPSLLQATGQAAAKVAGGAVKPLGVIGGSMTAVPEWEAAKEAGLSDEEAFETLLKNYLVGQTEAIPIERLMVGLNKITGGKILETVKLMGQQGLTEGVQEGVQTYLTNQIAQDDYDPDRDPLFQVLESAKVGGIVGMILPGAMSIAQNATAEKRVKLTRKLGELQANEAINEVGETGDPQLNAEIDAAAQIDPVDKQVLEESKIADAVVEEQKEVEAEEKLQEALEDAENTATTAAKPAEKKAEKPPKPSETPEYKIALEKVTKLQEQFAALPIEENADQLLFDLREARQALQKIAGKTPAKTSETKKTIEKTTGAAKPEKSVQLTPNEAVIAQIRIQDRGIKIGRDLTQDQVISKIKEAAKEANLTPKQTASLASRAEKVSLTPKSLEKYNEYVQKVVADADYTDKVTIAQGLRKKIRKRIKNGTPQEKLAFREFTQINPEDVNVDDYIKAAEETTQGFKPVTDKNYKPLNLQKLNDFTAGEVTAQFAKEFPGSTEVLDTGGKLTLLKDKKAAERREAQNERLRRKLEKDFTPEEINGFMEVLSSETDVDKEIVDLNKREQVRQAFKQLADQRQKDLPEIEDLSPKEQDILSSMKSANLSDLTADQLKLFIQISDRITENEDFAKSGYLPVILKAQQEYKNLEKLDLKVLGITDFEQELSANLPATFRAITGLPVHAAKFQLYLGIKGMNEAAVASVKASEDFVHKLNEMNDKFTKLYGTQRNGFTDESIFRQGIFAELIKHDGQSNPDEFLVKNKEAIEATIKAYNNAKQPQEAKVYDRLYTPFKKAKTLQEVSEIMNRIDPSGKKIVDFIVDYMKPYGQRVAESNLLYYNKPSQDIVNYAGESRWFKVSEVTNEVSIDESDIKDIESIGSYKLRPTNPKQDRSQMEFQRRIPEGKVLDFNLHHKVNHQIQRVHFKTEATPYMLQVREMTKNANKMKQVLGGSDKIYNKLFNAATGAYYRFENNLLNKGDTPSDFDRGMRNIMNTLRKWGYTLRLGGLTQWLKQPTVLINTAAQVGDPSIVSDSISEIYSNPDGYKEFVKGETVSMRGEQKSLFNIGDSYVASLDRDLKSEIKQTFGKSLAGWTQKVFENKITGIGALVRADRFAANPSFVAFYKKHLKDIGQQYRGFAEENKLRNTSERQEARAVAKQMLDDLQVVSNPAEMVAKMQSDRDYKTQIAKAILFPFGGFSTSTKQRLFSDYRAIFTGNSTQRNYAIKDISATMAEQAVFQTVAQFGMGYLWQGLGEVYEWAFDLPEEDDEEKYKKWWQRTWTGILLDNIPLILTAPGEEMFTDVINYTGYEMYKAQTGEDMSYKQYSTDIGLPLATYNRPNQSAFDMVLDYLGPISAPAQNVRTAFETWSETGNEDLSDEQKKLAFMVAAMQMFNFAGVWPSDVTSGSLRELREQKKMNKEVGGGGTGELLEALPTDLPETPNLPDLPELN